MTQTIDRESPVPYYEQLFDILRDYVVAGKITVGERLPSELELSREYGLARATVRQTLAKLESEGYARRVPRRGMFAKLPAEPSGWTVQDAQGFLELQLGHGRTGVKTVVADARYHTPPQHVARALQLAPDDEVFAIVRVRSLNGEAAMFSTNWFPSDIGGKVAAVSEVLDGTGSVNSALRAAGYVTHGAHRIVEALAAPLDVARHLLIDTDQPILRVRSLSWDSSGAFFDYYETWVLTDIVPLEVNVTTT